MGYWTSTGLAHCSTCFCSSRNTDAVYFVLSSILLNIYLYIFFKVFSIFIPDLFLFIHLCKHSLVFWTIVASVRWSISKYLCRKRRLDVSLTLQMDCLLGVRPAPDEALMLCLLSGLFISFPSNPPYDATDKSVFT